MPAERVDQLAGVSVPQTHRLVPAARQEPFAVRRISDAVDFLLMSPQQAAGAVLQIPHADQAVVARSGGVLAIGPRLTAVAASLWPARVFSMLCLATSQSNSLRSRRTKGALAIRQEGESMHGHG